MGIFQKNRGIMNVFRERVAMAFYMQNSFFLCPRLNSSQVTYNYKNCVLTRVVSFKLQTTQGIFITWSQCLFKHLSRNPDQQMKINRDSRERGFESLQIERLRERDRQTGSDIDRLIYIKRDRQIEVEIKNNPLDLPSDRDRLLSPLASEIRGGGREIRAGDLRLLLGTPVSP